MLPLIHGLTRFRCYEDKLDYDFRIQYANIRQIWAERKKGTEKDFKRAVNGGRELPAKRILTFPVFPSKTFVSDLEWWVFALISKLEFGLRMIISASDPTRIAPFLGYILKILALVMLQGQYTSQIAINMSEFVHDFKQENKNIPFSACYPNVIRDRNFSRFLQPS